MIAKVAVAAAVFSIDKPYDYRIPDGMRLQPGQRVALPFGRANKRSEGVILAVAEGAGEKCKPVAEVLDREPLLTARDLRLAAFLRERYFCTFFEAIKAILPAGVWFRETARYAVAEPDWRAQIHRKPNAEAVMSALEALGGEADAEALRRQFDEVSLDDALRYLQKKHLITAETSHKRRVSDKTERIAVLASSAEEARVYADSKRRSAPLQTSVLELLLTVGQCAAKDICYFTGATGATLNRLEKLGYLTLEERPQLRISHIQPAKLDGPLRLNGEQQAAFEGLRERMNAEKPGVALLYGVTGSGKTSVYIRLIYECLARGKSALLLVPEIALTPQLLALFAAHFGEKTAVLHSGLRITERYDAWKRIRSGQARVVLGTRSAVFAPLVDPGLFIIDEEQEHTYKSENSPRYHAREVAIYRGAQCGAAVLLGSATPSVETMYRAKTGVFGLYRLQNRYNGRPLPAVDIVDMKQELRAGNPTLISEPMLAALKNTAADEKQAILLLNRRGTSRMIACVDCGYVPMCPACTVNLTYHEANRRLMCHYCGHSEPIYPRCPQCGGHLKQIGAGTQKVQQQLAELLPDLAVERMDADTVSALNTHEKLLGRFRDERIPILLGTQMVAKGLNFENVTLVGVLDADMSLYVGNYRAAETTFNMITQVIGRAGRGASEGRAMIQTVTPRNRVIELAARQDYDAFFAEELPLRELRGCPPFRDLLTVTFHGRDERTVSDGARRFAATLEAHLRSEFYRAETVDILGPAPAQIARVNYSFRCRLTLSCRNTRSLRELLAHLMREFLKNKVNRGIGVYADVNGNE